MTFHHLYYILLLRGKSQALPTLKRDEDTKQECQATSEAARHCHRGEKALSHLHLNFPIHFLF